MPQHIFHKNSISSCRIVDENVGDSSDELSVLDDRAAGHALDDPAGEI